MTMISSRQNLTINFFLCASLKHCGIRIHLHVSAVQFKNQNKTGAELDIISFLELYTNSPFYMKFVVSGAQLYYEIIGFYQLG